MFSCCCAKIDMTWRGICGCHKGGWDCDNTCLHKESNIEGSYYSSAKVCFYFGNTTCNIYIYIYRNK